MMMMMMTTTLINAAPHQVAAVSIRITTPCQQANALAV
jgi:hypothetical protein